MSEIFCLKCREILEDLNFNMCLDVETNEQMKKRHIETWSNIEHEFIEL